MLQVLRLVINMIEINIQEYLSDYFTHNKSNLISI